MTLRRRVHGALGSAGPCQVLTRRRCVGGPLHARGGRSTRRRSATRRAPSATSTRCPIFASSIVRPRDFKARPQAPLAEPNANTEPRRLDRAASAERYPWWLGARRSRGGARGPRRAPGTGPPGLRHGWIHGRGNGLSLDPPIGCGDRVVGRSCRGCAVWCGGRALCGRVERRCLCVVCCQRVVVVCGRAGPRGVDQVSRAGSGCWSRAVRNWLAHGHRAGSRRTGRPLRLTSRPGRAKRRVRMVRVTVS